MKKIFAFLLLGLTVAFASCGDEKTETGTDWFLTPVAEVNGTTVGLSCQTRFGEGVLENTSVGFSYAAVVDNKIGAFADVAGSAVDGTGIAATLTGLQPETSYVVFAYAGLSTGRVQSAGAVFKTGQDDMPDPDPERPAFGTPAASGVTKTEATLNCTFNFEDTADYDVYFRYKPASSGSYDRVNVPTGTGTKTAALTGLTPGTTYEFRALRRLGRADLHQRRGDLHHLVGRRRRKYGFGQVFGLARTAGRGCEQRLLLRLSHLPRLFGRRPQSA